MKTIRYAYREMMRSPLTLLLLLVQSVIIYALVISAVSAVHSRFSVYREVNPFIYGGGTAVYADYFGKPKTEGGKDIMDSSEIPEYVKDTKVYSCYTVAFETVEDEKEKDIQMMAYDTELWKCHTPEMAAGRWFREKDETSDTLEVVLAQKDAEKGRYQVGDVLEASPSFVEMLGCEKNPMKVKIIGIVKDGASILGTNEQNIGFDDMRKFFWNYSGEYYEEPYLLACHKDIYRYKMKDALGMPFFLSGLSFITWDENNDKIMQDRVGRYLSENCGISSSLDFETCREYSKDYILQQLGNLLPILLALMFMAILTVISSTSIVTRQNIYKYAVFYMNGLTWKQCIRIQRISILLLQMLCILISWGTIGVLRVMRRLDGVYVLFSWWEIGACLLVMAVFYFFGAVTIRQELGKKSGKEVLTGSGGTI